VDERAEILDDPYVRSLMTKALKMAGVDLKRGPGHVIPKGGVTTVARFMAQFPPERRKELARVRSVIRKHLPSGYREALRGQMIAYEVPLATYRDTYDGQPLWLAALAAPKSYLTLHLMPVYGSTALLGRLRHGFRAAGKRLDIGKACIRFQSAEDLALDAIGDIIASVPVLRWVAIAKAARERTP
jgi:hypothetical protein